MKRILLSAAVALSLLVPAAPARPVAAADYGNCGVEQTSANTPLAFVAGDRRIYSFDLTYPCADKISVQGIYNARTKVALESLDRNIFGRPSSRSEWICDEDPWVYQVGKMPDCKQTSQEIKGMTRDDLNFQGGGGVIGSTAYPMSVLAISDTARHTLRALFQAEANKPAPAPKPQSKPNGSTGTGTTTTTSQANRFPLQTVKQSATGPNVEAIQHLLNHHGVEVVVDGDYGEQTAGAVLQFQNVRAIVEPGSVGPQTWAALMVTLKQGASFDTGSGNAVMALQTLLNKKGLDVAVDGDFGEQIDAAVRQFQTNLALDANGMVNMTVWSALLAGN